MAKKHSRFATWAAALITVTVAVSVVATAGRRLPADETRPAGRAAAGDANPAQTLVASVRDVPRTPDRSVPRNPTTAVALDGDLFWMNLTAAKARDSRSPWLQHADFRRAIAHAIDRQAFVESVYLGAGVPADSIVSPGNRDWHVAAALPEYDPARAKSVLASLGLSTKSGTRTLQDRDGRPVRFMLLTQKGSSSLERGAAVIRDSLARVGVHVDVVALEANAVVNYIQRGEYDAAYLKLPTNNTDPAQNLDFWLSSGSAHVWNGKQKAPSTQWESEIDALMHQVATSPDAGRRRQLFADVQRIMAREVPVLCFAFPR